MTEGTFGRRTLDPGEVSEIDAAVKLLSAVLAPETAEAWRQIVPYVPDWAYLAGGTALALHLRHRVSRDLDFFTERPFDAELLATLLTSELPGFAATRVETGTVNGVLSAAKLQFLDAASQRLLEEPTTVAGVRVAGVGDVLATKVEVIGDRPALRDYFDLMAIEQGTDLTVTEGFRLYVEKYEEGRVVGSQVPHLLASLGYFDDVDDDPGLPASKAEVERYWTRRQPEVARELAY